MHFRLKKKFNTNVQIWIVWDNGDELTACVPKVAYAKNLGACDNSKFSQCKIFKILMACEESFEKRKIQNLSHPLK